MTHLPGTHVWRERREFMPAILAWVDQARPHAVMVESPSQRRHLRVFFDRAGQPYVWVGRKASRQKKRLCDMAGARCILGTDTPIFYERPG